MKTPQTPVPQLAAAIGLSTDLYLKREDLHPYGSHKGRSIPLMVKTYLKEGIRHFVISSSGNAALAAIHTVNQHNKNNPGKEISLTIFVGNNIPENKLQAQQTARANQPHITIEQVDNPKQQAFLMDKSGAAKNLRQSTDKLALAGYEQLAEELAKIDNLCAVFIPTSSGTTAQALGKWFLEHTPHVQIHIVQTETTHPIAEQFDTEFSHQESSVARAIVDNIAHRKDHVTVTIQKTHGSGWIVSDQEIVAVQSLVKSTIHVPISPNSALSIAGLVKATEKGWQWPGAVVCLITGA